MRFKIFASFLISLLLTTLVPQGFTDSKIAVIGTKFGNMVVELFPNDAPKTVENFIKLAESGFYDGTKFHRIMPGFMIQGGDPLSKDSRLIQQWGTGDAGYTIDPEFNNIKHKRGIVSMARLGKDPNSASSQFFIVHKDSPFLDGKYTVFGRLITQESYDALDSIASLKTVHDAERGIPVDIPLNYGDAEISNIKIKNRSEIQNQLDLGEPERVISHYTLDETGNYLNTLFGFSFHVPQGWLVQEPEKTQPEAPDVVVVGPNNGEFSPVISFLVENTNGTSLENHIKETRKHLQPVIDAGRLKILSEEDKNINGYNAHVTDAKGSFISRDKIFLIKYNEIVIESNNKFYTLTYTNEEKNFDSGLSTFNAVLDSFSIGAKQQNGSEVSKYMPGISIGIGVAVIAAVVAIRRKKKLPKQKSIKR